MSSEEVAVNKYTVLNLYIDVITGTEQFCARLILFWRCLTISSKEHQLNEEIRDKELRVIDVDGAQLGILSAEEALKIAFEKTWIWLRSRRRLHRLSAR